MPCGEARLLVDGRRHSAGRAGGELAECCAACTKARGRGCAKWVFRGLEEGGCHLHTANATAEKAPVASGEMAPQPQ